MRAARAARLFFLVQPIRFLIHDVNVVVDVVEAEAHKYPAYCNFFFVEFNSAFIITTFVI